MTHLHHPRQSALVVAYEPGSITYGTYTPELDLPDRQRMVEATKYSTINLGWLYDRQIMTLPRTKPQDEKRSA
jgi:hypothetical protein